MPPHVIIIAASGPTAEVAVADNERVIGLRRLSAARKHARDLAPAIKELLAEAGWEPKSIDLCLVDVGPGSYTGLRVGLTVAKTICYVAKAEIVGVDAMTILALGAPKAAHTISAIVDAQQQSVYAAEFVRAEPGGALEQTRPTTIMSAAEWSAGLAEGTFITGPGLGRFRSFVPAHSKAAEDDRSSPTAEALYRAGMAAYSAGRRDDFWAIEPQYMRKSSAEEKWDRRPQAPAKA